MTYLDPHAKVTKICPHCGNQFESIAYYNQVYDKIQCYRSAKFKRRSERSNPKTPTKLEEQHQEFLEVDRFFAVIKDPTVDKLNNYAKYLLLDMTEGKPIRIKGTVPEWKPPKNIRLVDQHVEPPEWNLVYYELSPIEELLQK
jgi:hypothetical protein